MALSDNGFLGAIAGKKSLPTIEVAPARHSEGSPLALPSRARFRCACPRRYRREHSSRPQQGNGTSRNRSNQGCHTEGCRSPADKALVTWILHRPSRSGAWRTAHGGRIGGRRPGCYSSPPERFLDFQSDIAPGQPDIMQVAVGPLRQFAALPNPVAPSVQGVADLLHKTPTMMICHRIVRESGHFWLLFNLKCPKPFIVPPLLGHAR